MANKTGVTPLTKDPTKRGRGRVKGSQNKLTMLLKELATERGPAVANVIYDAAEKGDMQACKLVLERLTPPVRELPVTIDLPDATTVDGLIAANGVIIAAVSKGALTITEGTGLQTLLNNQYKVLEGGDLEQRIAALEEQQNG
ncbi:hypothetical protein V2P20_11460 [Methylobacter sp. Wu1]|uniref:hypothetical protein n=1 Tax=Methylobacter sp. Wu1 TaxID=3119359 RepID=UPI002F95135E